MSRANNDVWPQFEADYELLGHRVAVEINYGFNFALWRLQHGRP